MSQFCPNKRFASTWGQGHVKVASIWSAGACSRFLGGQLAARRERAREQARRKRQQAAALQIRPDRHYPVILQLWDFDVPLDLGLRPN